MGNEKYNGIPIEIGGVVRIVPPLSLGAMEKLHKELTTMTGDISKIAEITAVIDATFASLKRNYPEITRDEVADGIGLDNMTELLEAVMDVGGVKRTALLAAARPLNS